MTLLWRLPGVQDRPERLKLAPFRTALGSPTGRSVRLRKGRQSSVKRPWRAIRTLLRPKYDNGPLQKALREVLGERTMGKLTTAVCVPSYEMNAGGPIVFKTPHHERLLRDRDVPVWQVALASSAAPIYLPAIQLREADAYVDGGVWANNPVLVALYEAQKYCGVKSLEDVNVLSVGTGSQPTNNTYEEVASRGLLGWGWDARIIDVIFRAQARAAHNGTCQ